MGVVCAGAASRWLVVHPRQRRLVGFEGAGSGPTEPQENLRVKIREKLSSGKKYTESCSDEDPTMLVLSSTCCVDVHSFNNMYILSFSDTNNSTNLFIYIVSLFLTFFTFGNFFL